MEPTYPTAIQMPALTKREYFAGLALQGILASPETIKACYDVSLRCGWQVREVMASMAREHAEALISALENPKQD